MDKVVKEALHTTLSGVLSVLESKIARDLRKGKNIDLCLEAYNYWQDEERDGRDYIFNIDDSNDLKCLVDNNMLTAWGVFWVMSQKDSHFFTFEGEIDAGMRMISKNELIDILIANAVHYMAYAIMYVGRCGKDSPYANIYEEYITTYIEDFLAF
jgi:hypothetical protein